MIAVFSDTHENVAMVRKAISVLKDYNISFIVHCGDVISPSMLEEFSGFNLKFVYGNNDGERNGLAKKAESLGFSTPDDSIVFDYKDKKFFVTHIEDRTLTQSKINSQAFDYVLVGHTHKRKNNKIFKTRVINPGAMSFTNAPSFVLLDVEKDIVTFIDL